MKLRSSTSKVSRPASDMKLRSSTPKTSPPASDMKLRSGTCKKQALRHQKIPKTHPASKKITTSNLSSFLLQLPIEVKVQIYTYVLGGEILHMESGEPFHMYPCLVRGIAPSAQQAFNAESDAEVDEQTDASDVTYYYDRHFQCYSHVAPKTSWYTKTTTKIRWPSKRLQPPVNLLRTCRQIYHEANHVIYSANTFSFQSPDLLTDFVSHLEAFPSGSKTLALLRYLQLHITISQRVDEMYWNSALSIIGQKLTGLCSVDISIEQELWPQDYCNSDGGFSEMKNPSMFKENTFLTGMSKLGRLKKLREMTLIVSDINEWPEESEDEKTICWSKEQKRAWARDIVADVLGRAKALR